MLQDEQIKQYLLCLLVSLILLMHLKGQVLFDHMFMLLNRCGLM